MKPPRKKLTLMLSVQAHDEMQMLLNLKSIVNDYLVGDIRGNGASSSGYHWKTEVLPGQTKESYERELAEFLRVDSELSDK